MSAPVLELTNVHTYYGKIHALKGVSLSVQQGEIVTLIGSNGAGKTTTLRTISGLLRPKQGDIRLNGISTLALPPHKIVAMGVGHVPEGRGIFPALTVLENLEMGAFLVRDNAEIERRLALVFSVFPRLQERMHQRGGTLSGGEQQMLAIGRALMQQPAILLLDEPSMGLAPLLVEEIFHIIRKLNSEQGTTILLVEQNAQAALQIANRAYVLETGRITMSGPAQELLHDPRIIEAYLGL
ncbi:MULTISPECIES: ABC transporter ATP-binding protein [Caldilinea]|jgi:branched-chain amino acid transport system ATP-binding protein|uniref:Putative branched-chain amino acid ABC transporter ATP-binding protein n=2 Tax=Caldilinea TaxID=233191 RepID=I0I1N0_CALAS|nr:MULTISPECIES: ABC transporter ATP-binding protein [Caldilinea]BAL99167.1 putative branched-chain amino acid ABC transporter ATP-binding protein [Caldilinea aerophila DSM 14535 = NBRC 104270]GIV74241.1 MAG: ABC transporter ATP-binding protein [Caldilinea sp.]